VIVLDASVLIGFIFDQDAHHEAAVALLRDAADDSFGVSPVTLAEALVAPTRLGRVEAAERMLLEIGITEIPLPRDAAVALARLRVESKLKMPDCGVLLAAITSNGAVATFDSRLASAAKARHLRTLTL
jgi:predicted nucleic acid-binding protein